MESNIKTRERLDESDGHGSTFVSAFARGLSVIRCFSHTSPTLTISEVARATGLSRATARRFLHTLEAEGYVAQDGGRYSLRAAVVELGYAYLSTLSVDDHFRKALQELAEEVHQSCSAGTLDGTDVVWVARTQPSAPRVMTLSLSVGTRIPAHLTALGRVLLADLSPGALDDYFNHAELRRETPQTLVDPSHLRAVIAEAGDRGYSIVDEELGPGLRAVAVPVRRPDGSLLAVSVSAHSSASPIEKLADVYLPSLYRSAREIERLLQLPS